ncbi:MAG: alkaline phosphatase family protein [Methanobacteriota archaeon]
MTIKKTYVINVDGMRADYLGAMGHQGCLTPTLTRLASQGIRYSCCTSIMPANTGTNHTAILTSSHAGSHGILGIGGYYTGLDFQHFRLSRKYGMAKAKIYEHRHLQVPTFFNKIKTEDPSLITAFITGKPWLGRIIPDEDCDVTIYPGNSGDDNHRSNPGYVHPSGGYVLGGVAHPEDNEVFPRVYIPQAYEDTPKAPPGTINLSAADFDADKLPSDQWVIDQAIRCIDHENPDFLYMVLMNMDLAGHAYGAFTVEDHPGDLDTKNLSMVRNPAATRDQLALTDGEIKRFIEYLLSRSLFDNARIVITADHGMSTMKSMLSEVSRNSIFQWILGKLHFMRDPDTYYPVVAPSGIERLDIDIRQILADQGIHMRASPDVFLRRYNSRGDYDWCISEGPNGYIYNASVETQQRIKDILLRYSITENGNTIYPIWKVLTRADQQYTINEYTGRPFSLGKEDFLDVIWPSVMIFTHPHYMIPLYHDQLMSALMPLMIKLRLPGFLDIRTATGAHGTYREQAVPLILVSPTESGVPADVVQVDPVSVVDIIPTLTKLNGWSTPSSFEGVSLL